MFPFIIQLPQLETCCAIQLAISPHHAGEAVPPLVEPEPAAIHCWHVACSVVALPHIVAPVIRWLRSCWPIQSVMVVHQAALGEPCPRVGAEPVSYTHLRAHETGRNLVCRLLLEK